MNSAEITVIEYYFAGVGSTDIYEVDHAIRNSGGLEYLHDYMAA